MATEMPLSADQRDEIRECLRLLVHAHRRVYSLQTQLEELMGFTLDDIKENYDALLMAEDDDPVDLEDLDFALGLMGLDANGEDPTAVDRFQATFPVEA